MPLPFNNSQGNIDFESIALVSLTFHFVLRVICFILGYFVIKMGFTLIREGVKGEFKFSGDLGSFKSKLESVSPGLLFVLLGVAVIIYGIAVKRDIYIKSSKGLDRIEIPLNDMGIEELLKDTMQ